MKRYKVKIEPEALADIQDATDWYNGRQPRLGVRFQSTAIKQINSLGRDPQLYAIQYKEIRCMIVKRFPYMVHFYVNHSTSTVEVLAVISTSRDPKLWPEKTSKRM